LKIRILAWLLLFACTSAAAQSLSERFPERPVHLVVPFGPGGLADITMRMLAERLSPLLGKQVVIENQPGAGGVTAALNVKKARPDGHTLLCIVNGTAIAVSLFKQLPYDPQKDFTPVSLVTYFDLLILASGDSKYRTLEDLVAAAKANPGKLNFATINPGSTQNLSAQLFKSVAGIDVAIVPFRTSPDAAAAVVAGSADAVFESYAAMKGLISGGKLKPLASTGTKNFGYLPSVPIAAQAGVPGYEVSGWNAIAAPAGTPREVVAILNGHINTVVAQPDFKAKLLEFGTLAYAGAPEELGKQLATDIAKWRAVIEKAGIPRQ
jgi:tripartite-type tricarboxylate transporter receptor subunit TctC